MFRTKTRPPLRGTARPGFFPCRTEEATVVLPLAGSNHSTAHVPSVASQSNRSTFRQESQHVLRTHQTVARRTNRPIGFRNSGRKRQPVRVGAGLRHAHHHHRFIVIRCSISTAIDVPEIMSARERFPRPLRGIVRHSELQRTRHHVVHVHDADSWPPMGGGSSSNGGPPGEM